MCTPSSSSRKCSVEPGRRAASGRHLSAQQDLREQPRCPTSNSRTRLIRPTQITGVTSTPPIGATTRRVRASTGSAAKDQRPGPCFRSTWGYQVSTIRSRKARVQAASNNPSSRWTIGRTCRSSGVTKLYAFVKARRNQVLILRIIAALMQTALPHDPLPFQLPEQPRLGRCDRRGPRHHRADPDQPDRPS